MANFKDSTVFEGSVQNKMFGTSKSDGKIEYSYYVTTTDATATIVHSQVVPELGGCLIIATVLGLRPDGTEAIRTQSMQGFRRAAAGNVTAVGTTTVVGTAEDSSDTPTLTIVATTGTQSGDVKVTGEAAKTFNWVVIVEVINQAN